MIRVSFVAKLSLIVTVVYPSGGILDQDDRFTVKITVHYSIIPRISLNYYRWAIEQFHKDAKQVLGIDQFEGQSWKGWHHHVTIVMLTYAFIATERAAQARTLGVRRFQRSPENSSAKWSLK
jgi:hypothetical protein